MLALPLHVLQSRCEEALTPDHWVLKLGENPLTTRDVMERTDFTRSKDVTWEVQIARHGDGSASPGPQCAFKDPHFHTGGATWYESPYVLSEWRERWGDQYY